MKIRYTILLFFAVTFSLCSGQIIPIERICNWNLAGLRDTNTTQFINFDLDEKGLIADGITSNDSMLNEILKRLPTDGAILNFGKGKYLFNKNIELPSNTILKGKGSTETELIFDQKGKGHSIVIEGAKSKRSTSAIIKNIIKNSHFIFVKKSSVFKKNDWIILSQNDTHLITSSWAKNTVGQIFQIQEINGNKIVLKSPMRINIDLSKTPYLSHFTPANNVGIECLKITRNDNTAPQQSSNIYLKLASNCWVKGIESSKCTFSHIQARKSANISITNSFFHHGHEYGGGGRAYGVMLHATSNECLVENNIFKHLRHSMIVQSGANGNVFAYNYSTEPYWNTTPNNAAGDLVLHGNYPYLNLFEQNICANIIIDNSHGKNGPHNTFLRNRANLFGVFFSADNSPFQNIVGNEIPNKSFPYNVINYRILGKNQFLYGNNNKGTVDPINTQKLNDLSYYRSIKPSFILNNQWAKIGTPHSLGSGIIPAKIRYDNHTILDGMCEKSIGIKVLTSKTSLRIYPNPSYNFIYLKSNSLMKKVQILDLKGLVIYHKKWNDLNNRVDIKAFKTGVYFVKVYFMNGQSIIKKIWI